MEALQKRASLRELTSSRVLKDLSSYPLGSQPPQGPGGRAATPMRKGRPKAEVKEGGHAEQNLSRESSSFPSPSRWLRR